MKSILRTLGHRVRFQDTSVEGLLKNKQQILELTDQHGCICLENIDFEPKEQLEFTLGIFESVVTLPKQLAFNNQDPVYKCVTRVGNVLLDGTLKDSAKEAMYWHQDGNFWGDGGKHLFNFLHAREIPTRGGDTWVMDLVKGAEFLKEKKPELYEKIQQLVGELNYEEIGDFKIYGKPEVDIGAPKISQHRLIKPFNRYGYPEVLFLSVNGLREKSTGNAFQEFGPGHVHSVLMEEMGFYKHQWQKGDLLIWDNWQVMHRSSGDFDGRRLLYRTQGEKNNN